jgi:hypothetical protein
MSGEPDNIGLFCKPGACITAQQRALVSRIPLIVLVSAAVACAVLFADDAARPPEQLPQISSRALLDHARFFSTDRMGGRGTGEQGNETASQYIAAAFKRCGLTAPMGRDGFLQKFTLNARRLAAGTSLEISRNSGGHKTARTRLRLGRDYVPMDAGKAVEIDHAVVFAGYGITAEKQKYDDYAGLDVKGRVVLVLRHEPREGRRDGPFSGVDTGEFSSFSAKMRNARQHGASAVLIVTDPLNHTVCTCEHQWWRDMSGESVARLPMTLPEDPPQGGNATAKTPPAEEPIPCLLINLQVAMELLGMNRIQFETLQRNMDADLAGRGFEVQGTRVALRIGVETIQVATANIIGTIEGSDPTLKGEAVVFCAHFDHVGRDDSGEPLNGADDNASGTAGLLEIANAFAALPVKPRRTVVFAAFTAEEKGLFGAEYYARHPVLPMDKTSAVINLDMIGRLKDGACDLTGAVLSDCLREIVDRLNAVTGLRIRHGGKDVQWSSDHSVFLKHKVPALHFFDGGNADYHKISDDAGKLNGDGMERVCRLAFAVGLELADRDKQVVYVQPEEKK